MRSWHKTKAASTVLLHGILCLAAPMTVACPAYVRGTDLLSVGKAKAGPWWPPKRSQLVLATAAEGSRWRRVPLQVDPLDGDGRLQIFVDGAWRQSELAADDRLVFDARDLAVNAKPVLPTMAAVDGVCGGPGDRSFVGIWRLLSRDGRWGMLGVCPSMIESTQGKSEADGDVSLDVSRHVLTSSTYRYEYDAQNPMLFRSISVQGTAGIEKIEVARDASMEIRADVRNFFTLSWGPHDFEASLEDYRSGPLGVVGRIAFYLKVLFFKIRLALTTDVHFYRDSAHIPMVMHLPVDGRRILHPGSGVRYEWTNVGGGAARGNIEMQGASDGLQASVVRRGLKACAGRRCVFHQVTGREGGVGLGMRLDLPKALVRAGFFPSAVQRDDLHRGLYFETSGLAKGEHAYDFWIVMGGEATRACPVAMAVE